MGTKVKVYVGDPRLKVLI